MSHARSRVERVLLWGVGLAVPTLLLAGASCASGGFAEFDRGYGNNQEYALRAEPSPMMADTAPTAEQSMPEAAEDGGAPGEAAGQPVSDRSTEQSAPRQRLRVLQAEIGLVVSDPESSKQEIVDMATSVDGYVEASSADFIVIRIPAESFDAVVGQIENLGRLESRTITAQDVTEQFFELERRLEIARTSLARLEELLERTDDAEDRVQLLREITRLSEEIERLEAQKRGLENRIRMSRISVRLTALISNVAARRGQIPFTWMARLDPLYQTLGPARTPITTVVPPEFAVFEDGTRVRAESADGVRLRIGAVENDPRGDEQFWLDAIAFHLAPLYQGYKTIGFGSIEAFVFESAGRDPFYYLLAPIERDNELVIVEVFYPGAATRDQYEAGIARMLENLDL